MRQVKILLSFVLLALVQVSIAQKTNASPSKSDSSQVLTTADKDAVMQAIVDEMYAHHLQGYVADIGKQTSGPAYRIRAYFKPTLNNDRAGWVIYKLMPYGEVLRLFTVRSDGLAVLYGKPQDRFPPTQPSYLTVYMDDDELCRFKMEWAKAHFEVELKPNADRVAEALAREQKRKLP